MGFRLRAGRSRIQTSEGTRDFSLLQKSRPAVGPTQLQVAGYKGGIFSTKILKLVSFLIAKMNPKNFSSKKTIRYFVKIFALL